MSTDERDRQRDQVVAFFETETAAARAVRVVNLADVSDGEGRRAWLTLSNMPLLVCAHLEHARAWDREIAQHYASTASEPELDRASRRVAAVQELERAAAGQPHLLPDLLRFDSSYLYLPAVALWVHALKDPDFLHARDLMAPKAANDILKDIAAIIGRGKPGTPPKLRPLENLTFWHDLVAQAVQEHLGWPVVKDRPHLEVVLSRQGTARKAPSADDDFDTSTPESALTPLDRLTLLMGLRSDHAHGARLAVDGLRRMVDCGEVDGRPGRLEALVVGILAQYFGVDDETIKSRLKLEARQRRRPAATANIAIEDLAETRDWKIIDAWADPPPAPSQPRTSRLPLT